MTQIIAIVGATGTGKSALADALALQLGGEVISADSMQVYRGMDIGTAKTAPSERSVPYHCIDLVDPGFPFTAALYQRESRRAIEDVFARGITPVFCGGTGLYIRAALDHFDFDESREGGEGTIGAGDDGEGGDGGEHEEGGGCDRVSGKGSEESETRKRLIAQAAELGSEAFHAQLAERDPQSAKLIHPNNVRRVVRALELLEQGISYADRRAGFTDFSAMYPTRFIGLLVEPEVLYEVINRRVDSMIASGLIEEVRGLLAAGFREAVSAQQAIGYKELVPVLEGTRSLTDAIVEIKQSSRRFAKRQRTWFKRDPRIEWVDITDLHQQRLECNSDAGISESDFAQQLLKRLSDLLQLGQQQTA